GGGARHRARARGRLARLRPQRGAQDRRAGGRPARPPGRPWSRTARAQRRPASRRPAGWGRGGPAVPGGGSEVLPRPAAHAGGALRRPLVPERRAARGLVLRRDRPRHAGRAVSSPRPLERGDHAARHPVSGHGGALGRDRGRSRARERPRLGRDPARERGARERRRGERGPLPLERRPRAADGALTPPAPRAMPPASLAFVLHAHLPFVRHPAHEDFLEERWLAEAITETYIPLLEVLGALERDRVPTRLTLSLSPPLLAMLADPLLRGRYLRHLDRLVELAEKEERRTRADERFHRVAEMY